MLCFLSERLLDKVTLERGARIVCRLALTPGSVADRRITLSDSSPACS